MNASPDGSFCVVIPAYREGGRIGATVKGVLKHCPNVVVIDDGSPDSTADEAQRAGAKVLRHARNQGKGAAMQTGFRHAVEQGREFLITLDGDGQHDPDDIPRFVEEYRRTGTPVLTGDRMADTGSMPWVRRLTNRFMSALLSRVMGQRVTDTQSGYRLYRTDVLCHARSESGRFAAESEILLNLSLNGIRIGAVPIRVIYGDEKSKIRPIRDTIRFFTMLREFKRKRRIFESEVCRRDADGHGPDPLKNGGQSNG